MQEWIWSSPNKVYRAFRQGRVTALLRAGMPEAFASFLTRPQQIATSFGFIPSPALLRQRLH